MAVQLSVPGLYLPAGVQVSEVGRSAPDDHFAAGPHCRVSHRPAGALVVLVAVQLSVLGLYLPAGVQIAAAVISAPDDHFAAGPHCRVSSSASGRAGGAGGCPTVGAGIVSPAGVQKLPSKSTPDDHFAAGPHCRVTTPRAAGALVVLVAVQLSVLGLYRRRCSNSRRHHLRPRRSFRCRSTLPCDHIGQRARWWCW